ncbi:hypothetical protein R5H30_05005 [Sulfitobacter sp. D35]|uniref:hypothetical protein n=1 Tax=Sulfitobacter sp. D35 TaxID=3083252 RepID=UPI00296FC32E|nr:hypothetical protein [Sulfitobacter sp. D35]MDW4497331.1 hypothetical protein [Sulfitobacter sp. D35]
MSESFDRDFALAEYKELGETMRQYIGLITSTERLAVAGAAAFASFSVTGIVEGLEDARIFISAIPFVILALAGLRCLTLYLVIVSSLTHLTRLENEVLATEALGFNRNANRGGLLRRAIEATSGGYWLLACIAALAFWLYVNDIL